MALSKEYTNEELNYFRICKVTTDILAEGLRVIFKQEWDNQYKSSLLGEWKDDPQNGTDFCSMESPASKKRNGRLLATMKNGDRGEWDCTMLFYAILFSDCVGKGISAAVRTNVDHLREFRNEEFAHITQGNLSDKDFHIAISKVHIAFHALGLPTAQIQDIKNQRAFPTEELRKIQEQVDDLKRDLQETENKKIVLEHQLQKEAPSFCILPPKPSHEVGGRDREVAKITQQLRELKEGNDNKLSYLYISGNPGSGKSQLAGLVAQNFFDEVKKIPDASSFVMTLNAASIDSLLESYASFARQLKCPEHLVMEVLTSKGWKVEEKINHLKMIVAGKINLYTLWLIVVDNVSSVPSIFDFLPKSGHNAWEKGQLLITTQDIQSIPSKNSFSCHISVSKGMEPEDAFFLLSKLSDIADSELEKNVAEKLDYQPLALASAAIFVNEIRQTRVSKKFGWGEFLKKLDEGKRSTTEDNLANTNPIYPSTMTKAITLAVESQIMSDSVIKQLFNFLCLCAPQPLNLSLAINYIRKVDATDNEVICLRIKRCSLLIFEEDEAGCRIRVHQVVHNAIKTSINAYGESPKPEVVNGAVATLNQFITEISPENRTRDSMHLVPHLGALADHVILKGMVYDESILKTFENFGLTCRAHCEFNVAKKYFKLLAGVQLKELGAEHVDVAKTYNNLGLIHQHLGDFEQAKEYHERALTISLEKLGAKHVDVATTYNNLGLIHKHLGDFEQAKEYCQRALTISLEKLGAKHVDLATIYDNLGQIHQDLGDFEQAKEYRERALAISLKKLGAKHVAVATTYNNLGVIHQHLGDFEQAKEYYQRALTISLEKLGAKHVDVATTYNNLGVIHHDLGDFEQAKEYHERALAISLEKLGAKHVDVATTYNNLGAIHHDLGDFEQAREYHERALGIRLEKLGAKHVDVATTYNNLGLIHRKLGDFEQAKEYLERALAISLEKLGAKHVAVGVTYDNLGLIHQDLGDFQQAKEYHERALAISLEKLGAKHVDVATTYNTLGLIHRKLGDFEQAKEYHERALAIRLEKLGDKHVDVAVTYDNLGLIHQDLGDFEQAKEYHERALAIRLEKLGAKHVDVATTYHNLGLIHQDLGDFEQAKEYHERALAIKLEKLGAKHVAVATT
ncbi:unnamed protein product, partial [Porites evermanni]